MESWWQQLLALIPMDMVCRMLAAMGAGAVIGWEREQSDKPAGLRTHMLVSLGAASFMIGALELTTGLHNDNPAIRLDPMRALAGIIGGVGFLGAGAIIQSGGSVHGITTAASIWISAAIGTACGMALYQLALITGLLALLVLWVVGKLEQAVLPSPKADKASPD